MMKISHPSEVKGQFRHLGVFPVTRVEIPRPSDRDRGSFGFQFWQLGLCEQVQLPARGYAAATSGRRQAKWSLKKR